MVAAFGGEGIGDINGSRFGIRFDVFSEFCLQCFGVELVHLCEVLHGAFDGIHGEEVARFGSEFASDDVFIDAVISGDAHVVEGGLSSFVDSNFEVDGVVVDVDFDRIHAGEDVAVVVVEVCHGVIFVAESFVEEVHVIDVSLLHFQDSFHEVRRIDRVADPGDVSEVVFFSLIVVEIDVHVFFIDVDDAVCDEECIAEAPSVKFFDGAGFVFLKFFGNVFFGAEEVVEFVFSCLLHRFLHLDSFLFVVESCDVNAVDFDFLVFVDVDVHDDFVVSGDVFALHDFNFAVVKSFVFKVFFDVVFRAVDDVCVDLASGLESNHFFAVFSFAFFDAFVVDG